MSKLAEHIRLARPEKAGLLLHVAMVLCFSLMGIYWIRIAQFGGFSLEAYHLGLLVIIGATCASVNSPAAIYRVLVYCSPWILAYLAYLLLLFPAVAGTPGAGLLPKQFLFVAGFFCIAAYFLRTAEPARQLRIGALCGIGLYLAFTEYSAHIVGKSMISAVIEFLSTGSYRALIYGFFRPVFNSLETGADLTFVASVTNSIAGSLLVLSICFRIGFAGRGYDLMGILLTVVVLFFCLILNARSVVLAALASMFAAFVVRLVAARAVSLVEMLCWCSVAVALVGFTFVVGFHNSAAFDSVWEAFTFTDNSAESRLDQYYWALGLIDEQLFLGHGYVETDSGLPIHNLFLSSWAYTGLLGFALIVVFYVGLFATWLRWLSFAVTRPEYWTSRARLEWVIVLPLLPLFRVWISGAGGLPANGEWIALGVFAGLVMRSDFGKGFKAKGFVYGMHGGRRDKCWPYGVNSSAVRNPGQPAVENIQ